MVLDRFPFTVILFIIGYLICRLSRGWLARTLGRRPVYTTAVYMYTPPPFR
jgi:hypothetical protein